MGAIVIIPETIGRFYIRLEDGDYLPGWFEYYSDAEDKARDLIGAVVVEAVYAISYHLDATKPVTGRQTSLRDDVEASR